jgi:histone H3/H4
MSKVISESIIKRVAKNQGIERMSSGAVILLQNELAKVSEKLFNRAILYASSGERKTIKERDAIAAVDGKLFIADITNKMERCMLDGSDSRSKNCTYITSAYIRSFNKPLDGKTLSLSMPAIEVMKIYVAEYFQKINKFCAAILELQDLKTLGDKQMAFAIKYLC